MFAALTTKPRRNLASVLDAHQDDETKPAAAAASKEGGRDENDPPSASAPLQDVVACLTGMTPAQKDQHHAWIEALGGTYSRDFQASRNTHLIAQHPSGDKYQAAIAHSSIHVVKPSWLEECYAQNCRIDEDLHSWHAKKRKSQKTEQSSSSLLPCAKKPKRQSLVACLQQCLMMNGNDSQQKQHQQQTPPTSLFSSCQFYLVGFEEHEDKSSALLGRLIRRGMGTIFWGFQEGITHIIVHDDCSDAIRESISKAKIECFDETVTLVSPWWVLECWDKQQLVSPYEFPASLEKRKKSHPNKAGISNKKKKDTGTIEKVSNLLKGYLFIPLRISNPPNWMVDYDIKELEKMVRSHGGQLLSLKLLEALKSDHQQTNTNTNTNTTGTTTTTKQQQEQQPLLPKRKCHVLCWGGKASGANAQQQFALHPLLSQVQRRNLCEVVMATPNWLQTCVLEQKMVDPTYLPQLFQPQTWPWRRLVVMEEQPPPKIMDSKNETSRNDNTDQHHDQQEDVMKHPSSSASKVRISVTGFTGHRRTAMIQAIQAAGAIYDDSMRQHITTHLICAERAVKSSHNNQKFQKAQEWGIHVVSADWLYHILQHGSGGGGSGGNTKEEKNGENDGGNGDSGYCEYRFSVVSEGRHKQQVLGN